MNHWAPQVYQENYDNAQLIVGNKNDEIKAIIITLDVTEEVVTEAIKKGANLIIAHHPIIFKGLKKLRGDNYIERVIIKAIKNDIAIFASHTNLDHVVGGVNWALGQKIGLQNLQILDPKAEILYKLETYVPENNTEKVLKAIFEAGAGQIGNYSECAFTHQGQGSFTANAQARPTIGQKTVNQKVSEIKIEVLVPLPQINTVLAALKKEHPYEEVAYFLTQLENKNQTVGAGAVGELENELEPIDFLNLLKNSLGLKVIKHTFLAKKIKKVAICGGAGSFLLSKAFANGADAFVTADYKYHEFFDAEGQILIADIGHYESENCTKELIHFQLSKKFTNFAILLSEIDTNPVQYHY